MQEDKIIFEQTPAPMPLTHKDMNRMSDAQILGHFKGYENALHDKKAEICQLREEIVSLKETLECTVEHRVGIATQSPPFHLNLKRSNNV